MYGARAQTIRDRVATIEEACTASAISTVLLLSAKIKIEGPRVTKRGVENILSAVIGSMLLLFTQTILEELDAFLLLYVTLKLSTISLGPLVSQNRKGACTSLSPHSFVSFTQRTF